MFQFTYELVLNSQLGKGDATAGKETFTVEGKALRYLGANILDKKYTKVAAADATKATGTVAFTTDASNAQRLAIRVKLSGDAEASFAESLSFFSKPTYVEIPAGSTIDQAIALVQNAIKPIQNHIVITKSGTNIVGTAVDGFQQFVEFNIETFTPRSASFPYEGTWTVKTTGTITAGNPGFGTYDLLIASFRLPTTEVRRYASVNQDELPIPGAKYTMFEFTYDSGARNIGGAGVVGEKGRSYTKHRFWVLSTAATLFETELQKSGATAR